MIKSLDTNKKDLESQISDLKYQVKQLQLVIKCTGLATWEWNIKTGETIFNERWANIIGYTLEEISPVSIETWVMYAHPEDLKKSERLLKKHWAGETEYYICESRMKHKNGLWIWVYDIGQVVGWVNDGTPKRMIGTHSDITKKKKTQIKLDNANKQLKKMSYIDSLTELPNRRAYDEKIASEILAAKRSKVSLSLLMIDIDNFKGYNDSYGHKMGDMALFKVAQIIKKSLPRRTDFACRYGGEEFVAILPSTDIVGATSVSRKILQNIFDAGIEHVGSNFNHILTVSIGVASVDSTFDKLLIDADKAVYRAKNNGRNRYEIYTSQ
jgi:diguanylate cyclase (GGDEF)-like protein/PAS domain S-box-containing protein